jgi:hypothetical protein
MVTVSITEGKSLSFTKQSLIKIISDNDLHEVFLTDGSSYSFTMSATDFVVKIVNKLS